VRPWWPDKRKSTGSQYERYRLCVRDPIMHDGSDSHIPLT